MKKKITTLFLLAIGTAAIAQIDPKLQPGIGIGTALPAHSAMLHLEAANKGIIIPRIELKNLKEYQLDGGGLEEGVLIYNNVGTNVIPVGFYYWTNVKVDKTDTSPAIVPHWELIVNQTELNTKITNVTNEFNKKLGDLTTIGDGTNLSYLVAFKPDAADSSTGSMSYLVPKADGTGYDPHTISFKDLVAGSETETFIREEREQRDINGAAANVVVAFRYFSEKAVRDWLAVSGNKIADIPDANGFKIDVVGAVSNDFSKIFDIKENKTFVENIVNNTAGNVSYNSTSHKFTYKNEAGELVEIDFNALETKTTIGKIEALTSGDTPDAVVNTERPLTLEKGDIVYEYDGEEKDKKNYINLTTDLVSIFTNSEKVKTSLNKIIKEYTQEGGNVYFGPIVKDGPEVLYRLDPATGVKTQIDISGDILEVITNNKTVIEKIKEATQVVIIDGKDTETGEVLGDKKVYKGSRIISVAGGGYDTKPKDPIVIKPMKTLVDASGNATQVEITGAKFGRLLKVSVLDKGGNVVIDSATDVSSTDTGFEFYFGVGNMYIPLTDANNDYEVIFEYTLN